MPGGTSAVRDQGLKLEWEKRSSDLDIAIQVWLADPLFDRAAE